MSSMEKLARWPGAWIASATKEKSSFCWIPDVLVRTSSLVKPAVSTITGTVDRRNPEGETTLATMGGTKEPSEFTWSLITP